MPKLQEAIDQQAILGLQLHAAAGTDGNTALVSALAENETEIQAQLKAYASQVSNEEQPLYEALGTAVGQYLQSSKQMTQLDQAGDGKIGCRLVRRKPRPDGEGYQSAEG